MTPPQGPPARASRAGLFAGIAAAVLVALIGVFVVTGFVVPGFLLDTDTQADGGRAPDREPWCEPKEPNPPNIPANELPPGAAGELYTTAERLTQAVVACNDEAGQAHFCDPATWPSMTALGEGYRLMFLGRIHVGRDAPPNADGSAEYERTEQGRTEVIQLGFLKQDGRWCVGTRG